MDQFSTFSLFNVIRWRRKKKLETQAIKLLNDSSRRWLHIQILNVGKWITIKSFWFVEKPFLKGKKKWEKNAGQTSHWETINNNVLLVADHRPILRTERTTDDDFDFFCNDNDACVMRKGAWTTQNYALNPIWMYWYRHTHTLAEQTREIE